jgi:hypothetical protein
MTPEQVLARWSDMREAEIRASEQDIHASVLFDVPELDLFAESRTHSSDLQPAND